MKPSEIIAEALKSGELKQEDVTPPPPETEEDGHGPRDQPLAPPSAPGPPQTEKVGLSLDEEDSDRESDYEGDRLDKPEIDSAEVNRELEEAAAATVKEDDDVSILTC